MHLIWNGLTVLQVILGHEDIQTTINTYGKIYDYFKNNDFAKYEEYVIGKFCFTSFFIQSLLFQKPLIMLILHQLN